MSSIVCLDSSYSTTRLVTKQKPNLISRPEDQFKIVLFLPEGDGRIGSGGLREKGYFKKGHPENPLLTVLTVVFNGEKHLEETILSVIRQNYDNVEYIIIDGGSSDGTVDIIRKYEKFIDYWISEKDEGIYDAMNKGNLVASGDYIVHINCGDIILPNASKNIFETGSSGDLLVGRVRYESGRIFRPFRFRVSMIVKNKIHHQGVFYSTLLVRSLGLYDKKYKILSDYHLNLRIVRGRHTLKRFDEFVAICSDGGLSDQPKWLNYKEEISIRFKIYGMNIFTVMFAVFSLFRFVCKRFLYFSR